MAREVPQYIQQLQMGSMPQVQFSNAREQMFNKASQELEVMANDSRRKAEEIEALQVSATFRENMHRMAEESGHDVNLLKSKVDGFKKQFIPNIKNSSLRQKMEINYDVEALPYIDRANAKYTRVLDEEHKQNLVKTQALNMAALGDLTQNLFSPIPEVKAAAQQSLATIFDESAGIATARNSDGTFVFSPEMQVNMAADGQKIMLSSLPPEKQIEVLGDSSGGFASAMPMIFKHEGGFNPSDGNTGQPANFGINQKFHPDVDVRSLTKEQAAEIYKRDYWDFYKIDELPANVQGIVMDGVVNHWSGFKDELVKAARAGASPSELLDMRQKEYDRLAKTGKYSKSEITSWNNRLNDYEHLTIADQLTYLDSDVKTRIKENAYREIDALNTLRRENPVKYAARMGATSLDEIVAMQPDPMTASVIENQQAKDWVSDFNTYRTTDQVVGAANQLKQQYGDYLPNAIADLKGAGKMKPELEAALALSIKNDARYKEHIDMLAASSGGSAAIDDAFAAMKLDKTALSSAVADEYSDYATIMAAEGAPPQEVADKLHIVTTLTKAKMVNSMSQDLGDALDFAMRPDMDSYTIADMDGKKYRIPATFDVGSIEDRLPQAFEDIVAPLSKTYAERGYRLKDDITPIMNAEEDGLRFKLVDGNLLKDLDGNVIELKYADIINTKNSEEIKDEALNESFRKGGQFRRIR